jgi:hypothetical protein
MKSYCAKSLCLVALFATLLTQTACTLNLADAATAGVYDFVTGSVTDLLGAISPFNALTEQAE